MVHLELGQDRLAQAHPLKDKGSLEPGKFADLAVLSQDIFSVPPQLPKTESVLTMVGGKIVFDAKALSMP